MPRGLFLRDVVLDPTMNTNTFRRLEILLADGTVARGDKGDVFVYVIEMAFEVGKATNNVST